MKDWFKNIGAIIQLELKEYFRYKLAVISSFMVPLVMLIAFGFGMRQREFMVNGNPYITFIVPGIIGLGIMFSSIFSAGYTILLDRQRKMIDDIILSPVSFSSFVSGRLLSNLIKSSMQFVITLLGVIFWLKQPVPDLGIVIITFTLTCIFFSSLGIIVATLTDMISFAGFANLITVPLMYFCGVFFPIEYFKGFMVIFHFFPFTSSIELFRFALIGKTYIGTFASNLLILTLSALLLLFISIVVFQKSVTRNFKEWK